MNIVVEKIKNIDYKEPVNIMLLVMIPLSILAGGHYIKIGVTVGTLQAIGIMLLFNKMPKWIVDRCKKNAFASDLILSAGSTYMVSSLFGEGLTLGISAITCALWLSWSLPKNKNEK